MTKTWTIFKLGSKRAFGKGHRKGTEIATFYDNDEAAEYTRTTLNIPVTGESLASCNNEVMHLLGGKYGVDVYYVMG